MNRPSSHSVVWLVALLSGIGLAVFVSRPSPRLPAQPISQNSNASPVAANLAVPSASVTAKEIVAEREVYDRTVWGDEVAAQKYEQPLVELWDRLRANKDAVAVFADLKFDSISLSKSRVVERLEYGITHSDSGNKIETQGHDEFVAWLRQLDSQGFELVQSEWHHGRFSPASETHAARSVFNITLHATGPDEMRYIFEGPLSVDWRADTDAPEPQSLRLGKYKLLARKGGIPFVKMPLPETGKVVSHPLLVRDVNGDGLPEILIPSQNTFFENQGGMKFQRQDLLRVAPPGMSPSDLAHAMPLSASVLDDFTGNGGLDLVIAVPRFGVFLYRGAEDGFSLRPERIFAAESAPDLSSVMESELKSDLQFPSVITSGDLDGNGTTDLWIGQYKESMANGGIPDPIFDANSGYPSYLLINHGNGKFEERSVAAGLNERRHRWTYTASFWDFDEDRDLDLITVNDFSGVDAYENDSRGNFKMVTDQLVDERANFGMGHTIADFNRDGHLDFYVTGMSSTTARRLEALGLRREGFPEIDQLRMRMAFGNRMYMGSSDGRFRQPEYASEVARSGWAWGVAPIDLGNDGFPELYVANGHRSGKSCRDYCTEFWTHDVYLDGKLPAATTLKVFEGISKKWGGGQSSWNGFEKNALFLNRGGTNFVNVAFLFGLGFEYDARTVVVEDLDADGRLDLLVVQIDSNQKPPKETVHLYRNQWEENGNWIGVNVSRPSGSICGTRVVVETADSKYPAVYVNGDSFYCQHSAVKHFGLGSSKEVSKITVTWPDSRVSVIEKPAINKYHQVSQ